MNFIDTIEGDKTVVTRSNIYSDVLTLYQCGFAQQYPIIVEFKGEKAVDCGGLSKEMYSSFWEQAYLKLFDGDKVLTPLLHSSESDFNFLGKVIFSWLYGVWSLTCPYCFTNVNDDDSRSDSYSSRYSH